MYKVILQKSNLNPFPNKPWFLRVCSTSLLKTLWEKEKLLITSNFSFSHSVFYPFGQHFAILIKLKIVICKPFQFGGVQSLSFGKGLIDVDCNDVNFIVHTKRLVFMNMTLMIKAFCISLGECNTILTH